MIGRIFVAGAIGLGVFLLFLFVGGVILPDLKIKILSDIGAFMVTYAVVFGVIAAVLAFFSGYNPLPSRRP